MHLINDIYLVFACLWRNPYLVYQVTDVINRVIRSCIQLKYIERKIFIRVIISFLIYFAGKYPGAGSFTNTPWAGKQQCLCKMIIFNGIKQSIGNSLLPYNTLKGLRAVLSG